MEKKYFAESELIINKDGSVFHLHVKPEDVYKRQALQDLPMNMLTILKALICILRM